MLKKLKNQILDDSGFKNGNSKTAKIWELYIYILLNLNIGQY